jgi:hypothetical protein
MMSLENLERAMTDGVSRIVPWLTPMPTAFLTGRATVNHLHWPDVLGVVVGLIVEGFGLGAVNTALEIYNYNRSRRKTDPAAPLWIALFILAVYFVAVTGLTVLLDTLPDLSVYAPVLFPTLSIAAVTLLALRADHRRRLAAIAEAKADRSAHRSGNRSGSGSGDRSLTTRGEGQLDAIVTGDPGHVDSLTIANEVRRRNRDEAIQAALAHIAEHPDATFRDIGKAAGRSKPWAIEVMGELANAGKVHRNGKGWEVLDQ